MTDFFLNITGDLLSQSDYNQAGDMTTDTDFVTLYELQNQAVFYGPARLLADLTIAGVYRMLGIETFSLASVGDLSYHSGFVNYDINQVGTLSAEIFFTTAGTLATTESAIFSSSGDLSRSDAPVAKYFSGLISFDNSLDFIGRYDFLDAEELFINSAGDLESDIEIKTKYLSCRGDLLIPPENFFIHNTGDLVEKDWSYFYGSYRGDIGDPAPVIPQIPVTDPDTGETILAYPGGIYDIKIDGESVKNKITACSMEHDESGVHNRIDLSSADNTLLSLCNPESEHEILISIGDKTLSFFMHEITPENETEYNISGLSWSAKSDELYHASILMQTTEKISAKEFCENLIADSDFYLDWQIDDFILNADVSFEGTPIEIIQLVGEIPGAIIRASESGKSLIVRKELPVRPIDLKNAVPVAEYDRTNIVAISGPNATDGEGYNSVEIIGDSGEGVELPDIEIETPESPADEDIVCDNINGASTSKTSYQVGDTAIIRVYWAGNVPNYIESFATSGIIRLVDRRSAIHRKTLEFKSGTASVDKPISKLVSVSWIGKAGGDVEWKENSKDITITKDYAIADVEYLATYHRYTLSNSSVEKVMGVLKFGGGVSAWQPLTVTIRPGDKPADAITDTNINTDAVAIARGTAHLDSVKYDTSLVPFTAPYHPDVTDGEIISLDNDLLKIFGNYHVIKSKITFDGPAIWQEIEAKAWQV